MKIKLILLVIMIILIRGNSFAWFWEKDYIAKVNGEIIDKEDFEKRLNERHRQISMHSGASKAAQMNLRSALEDFIDDFLIYQEGCRLGLDKDPDFMHKAGAYLEFMSVIRLRQEEIKDKIKITESDLKEYYIKHFKNSGADEKKIPEYEKVKNAIRKKLYNFREEERERQYLDQLKQKSRIEIDSAALSSIEDNKNNANEIVARIDEDIIYVSDLKPEYEKKIKGKQGEDVKKIINSSLDGLIEYRLIRKDALSHNYSEEDPSFGKMIYQYRISLMSAVFKGKIIYPQVKITDETAKKYYNDNKEKYRKEGQYKLSVILVKSKNEAENLYNELNEGADFNRLAKLKSVKIKGKSNNPSWWSKNDLTPSALNAIETMNPGDVSGIIKANSDFQIIKLIEIKKGPVMSFPQSKKMIMTFLGREMFKSILDEYLGKLRQQSSIKINEEVLKEITKKYAVKVNANEN